MADDRMAPDLARLLHQLRRREARRRGGAELTYREVMSGRATRRATPPLWDGGAAARIVAVLRDAW